MARASRAAGTSKKATGKATKKATTASANRSTASRATKTPQSAQVKHLGTLLAQQRKEANAVEKKLATVRARVKKARERARTAGTKASENALIKARADASALNQQINQLRDEVRETRRKLKTETLLSSIVEAEQKAEQSLTVARERLETQAEEQLNKALARFEASWTKKKTAQIDRQLKKVEKTAAARVAAVEKKVLAQVKELEKKAESGATTKHSETSRRAKRDGTGTGEPNTSAPTSPAASGDEEAAPSTRDAKPKKSAAERGGASTARTSRTASRAKGTIVEGEVKSKTEAAPRRRGRSAKVAAKAQ